MKRRYNAKAIALVAAWIIYLGFIGPYLISEPSDVAVVLGILLGLALAFVTNHWATRPASKKEDRE